MHRQHESTLADRSTTTRSAVATHRRNNLFVAGGRSPPYSSCHQQGCSSRATEFCNCRELQLYLDDHAAHIANCASVDDDDIALISAELLPRLEGESE